MLGNSHFNSRPHGGRQEISVFLGLKADFNSRPHGGRHGRRHNAEWRRKFQLTPSRRATGKICFVLQFVCISTHALTEGDSLIGNNSYAGNISTHALTEGDEQRKTVHGQHIISTHALTEGDSMRIHCVIAKSDISTHALTEGDHNLPVSHHCSLYFNSRPHGGRRYKAPR